MTFFVGGQMLRAGPSCRLSAGSQTASACGRSPDHSASIHLRLWSNGTFQAKLALVTVVVALVLWHMRHPWMRVLGVATFLVSPAIVWLGLYLANGYS